MPCEEFFLYRPDNIIIRPDELVYRPDELFIVRMIYNSSGRYKKNSSHGIYGPP